MILLYLILLALGIYSIFFISQLINITFRGYAPLISTDKETIKKILDEIEVKEQSMIYELGCGHAKFLRIMEKNFPKTNLIGVENLLSVYLITKIKLKLKRSKIKLIKTDFFKIDLKNANLIYCYLNNTSMEQLGSIFKQNCKNGTQVISRSFPIPQFKPEKVIKINNKKIYFYKIN